MTCANMLSCRFMYYDIPVISDTTMAFHDILKYTIKTIIYHGMQRHVKPG